MRVRIPRHYRPYFRKRREYVPPPDLPGFGLIDPRDHIDATIIAANACLGRLSELQEARGAPPEYLEIHDKNLEETLA